MGARFGPQLDCRELLSPLIHQLESLWALSLLTEDVRFSLCMGSGPWMLHGISLSQRVLLAFLYLLPAARILTFVLSWSRAYWVLVKRHF